MCNISGFNGGSYFNPLKLKLLLAMGSERGEDSIGIVVGNVATKEVKTSLYNNYYNSINKAEGIHFIQEFDYPEEEYLRGEYNVLQHNRKKSSGFLNIKAAHPYEIVYEKEGKVHSFFFMHNGTLTNTELLAEKYKIKETDFETDSHMLAYLIFTHGFESLKYYDGNAAVAFYWSENPNELFLYKGSKIITKWDTMSLKNISTEEDERPLHYIYLKEGVYFSSLLSQLTTICDDDEKDKKVYTVIGNNIFKFKDGKLVDKIVVKREPLVKKDEPKKKFIETAPKGFKFSGNRAMIAWYEGVYRLIKKKKVSALAHGPYKLDGDGVILKDTDTNGKYYYFIDGQMIKDVTVYNEILMKYPSKVYNVFLSNCHMNGCVINENGRYNSGSYLLWEKLYRPLFSHYFILTDGFGNLVETLTVEEALSHKKMTNTTREIEAFNTMYGTKFNEIAQCKDYYTELTGKYLDWTTIDTTVFKPETTVTVLPPASKTYVDQDLKAFNHIYTKCFATRKQANTWHLAEYGREYDIEWPIDEKEETCDIFTTDLPFDCVDYSQEVNKEFEKEYKELKSKFEEFYADYCAYEELTEDNRKVVTKIQKLIKIL